MTDPLHGVEADVDFDHAVADALISFCTTTASTIEGQRGVRVSAELRASRDFEGYFSRLFTDNASTARADAGELQDRLEEVADHARHLKACAIAEQQRREKARAWMQDREDRNWFERKWDDATESEEDATPPVGPPDPEPSLEASPPRRGVRLTPDPGAGGGGQGGTSSARPEDLRSFASTSQGQNSALSSAPSSLSGHLSRFAAECRWGFLRADGVVTGFRAWNEANEEDVAWARTVATAFAQAGGDGAVSTLANSAIASALAAAGVDATRDDITIAPATSFGVKPTTGYAVDPVNTATGNFIEVETDLRHAGSSAGLVLERTYNSFDDEGGAFGPGWASWTEAGLVADDEAVRVTGRDGRVSVFPREGSGWAQAVGESRWIARAEDGWRMSDNDGAWWDFDSAGRLVELSAGHAAGRLLLERSGGLLVRILHSRGRELSLTWDDQGHRVVAVRTGDGRRVGYTYEEGRLVSVTGPLGTRRYEHDEAGRIRTVTDGDGVVEVENEYDERGRVSRQRTQHGRIVRFAYLPGGTSVVSDEDGTRSNTWVHDARGRLVGLVDSDERRQSMSYDGRGNLVVASARDGAATVHEYDVRGRRTRTVAPGGLETTTEFDDLDRVVSVATASGSVTRYEFADDARTPSVVVDPEGGRTTLRWDAGLLTSLEDPTGVRVSMTYDEHGDLVSATDAAGSTARMVRDGAGRIVESIAPGGARTVMTYDEAGLPLTRRDPDGALWRFEHSPAGRLRAVTDPLGSRTTIEQGAHGDDVRTIDPLGRAVTRTLDDLGNLATAELADGTTWRYHHDALSRLVATVDPTGAEWRSEHDATGNLVATLDPTGRRRTIRSGTPGGVPGGAVTVDDGLVAHAAEVDPRGRLVTSTQPDGSSAVATYDRCGRVVETLDADGNLTRVTRDAAGRPVAVVGPTGATTRIEHDVCGRVSAVVDPTGARTTRTYDADGRLVRQTMPTGEVARAEYDACGRVTALHRPGQGAARYVYDAAGRVVESSETRYGRRRFRYDAAGQVVAVTNGLGATTRFEYDAAGRCVATIDPLGATTRREFDALGRGTAYTDPLGRTTRTTYDASGRVVGVVDPDGRRTSWTHDASGRWATRSVDDALQCELSYDPAARVVTLREHGRPGAADGPLVHVLEWDRRQLLVRRSRGERQMTWEYDAAGRRSAMTSHDGSRTTYDRDRAGRVTALSHPLIGQALLERDASARVVRATSGELHQTWTHHEGWVVAHEVTGPSGVRATGIERDADGRVEALVVDGARTELEHDAALQLVARRGPGTTTTWRYDAAGRLVEERTGPDGAGRTFEHDAAGQLVSAQDADGSRTTYSYDGLGRRTRSQGSDGSVRELAWSADGWLAGVTDRRGDAVRRTDLHVDVTGELADVDGVEAWWDSASAVPDLVQVDDAPVHSLGAITGVGREWSTPGWRTARSTAVGDPWAVERTGAALPPGIGIGAGGELVVAGLEWMGARVYDPVSHGFLSVDPLAPVEGTATAANPYAFAGNDPWHALDPLGLRPATDADLAAYGRANAGALAGAIKWVDENTDYIVGGLITAAGVVAFFLPIPGAQIVGGMLMSAGVNVISQRIKAGKDGEIDLVEVGISAAFGAVGGAGTSLAVKAGVQGVMKQAMVGGGGMGATEGLVSGSYDYLSGPGPHTLGGYGRNVGGSVVENTIQGVVQGPIEAKIDGLSLARQFRNADMTPTFRGLPDDPPPSPYESVAIGNGDDTAVLGGLDGTRVTGADSSGYDALRQAVDHQKPVYLASEPSPQMDHQMDILRDAGYTRQGDYMVPSGG